MKRNNRPAWVNPRLVRPHGWSPRLHINLAEMPDEERERHVVSGLYAFTGEGERAELCYHFYTNRQAIHSSLMYPVWTPGVFGGTTATATMVKSLQELTPYIADEKILEVCQSLVKHRQLLDDIKDQLGRALADFLGLSPPRTEQDFRELGQQVDDYRLKHGPAWASQAEIQPLIVQLKEVFVEMKSLELELQARLRPYDERIAPSYEEIGDQRAHDLVDQALEEANTDTAIRLLKKALRYGKTGIQASKAYMELGGRYSDLGDTERAIEHYTKSIEAYKHPSAIALYWRGELYYQQEEWAKARGDFERAVAIGLYSPEYEQAQEYLSELRTRESGA